MVNNYKKLVIKISALIVSFSLIPLLVLGVFLYHHFYKSYTTMVFEHLRMTVEKRKKTIDFFFNERLSQLITVANTHTFEQITKKGYLEELFSLMQSKSKYYVDIGVIDKEGNHVVYVGPYNLKGVNYKNTEWFHNVCLHGVYISDVFLGFRKVPHFIIAVMRREHDNFWILRTTVNTELFESLVSAAKKGRRGDAFLVNEKGEYQTNVQYIGQYLDESDRLDISFFDGTRVFKTKFSNKEVIVAATWLETKKWMLVVMEDPKEEFLPVLEAKQLAVVLFIAGVGAIVLGALWVSRSMMLQLEKADKERAYLDAELTHSSKMAALGRLAAGIAHEINNPLAIIREKAGWLKDLLEEEDLKNSENFKEFLDGVEKIEYHVERAREVTHRLLSFARRMEPRKDKVDINRVINETISFLENEAIYRNIHIHRDFDTNIPEIVSDFSQLQQVFLNIINNAIDAIDRNGHVWIETKYNDKNNYVVVKIADSGPGIPPGLIDKIFEPFVTTKPVGKGVGLGLSITHGIIARLGGRIWAENGKEGGAIFTIELPVNATEDVEIEGIFERVGRV